MQTGPHLGNEVVCDCPLPASASGPPKLRSATVRSVDVRVLLGAPDAGGIACMVVPAPGSADAPLSVAATEAAPPDSRCLMAAAAAPGSVPGAQPESCSTVPWAAMLAMGLVAMDASLMPAHTGGLQIKQG